MGSLSGGSKRENVQKENAVDLSKFLHFANPHEINLNHVLSIHKIEEYLNELVKRNLGRLLWGKGSGMSSKYWFDLFNRVLNNSVDL